MSSEDTRFDNDDWFAPGSKVCIFRASTYRTNSYYEEAIVSRITKTQIIVDRDGTEIKFRRNHELNIKRFSKIGERVDYFAHATQLYPPDHAVIKQFLFARDIARSRAIVSDACNLHLSKMTADLGDVIARYDAIIQVITNERAKLTELGSPLLPS